ncbi:MAG: hypothetical protein WDZ81_00840 [Candidatus Saccharimonadales bacterium]
MAKVEKQQLPQIVPTVTPGNPEEYERFLKTARTVSDRVHLDFTDGEFAPSKTISLAQSYWDESLQVDLHLMLKNPELEFEHTISLKPQLVIVHAEAAGFNQFFTQALEHYPNVGIKLGVALLPETDPKSIADMLKKADHALVFTGKLGFYSGEFLADNLNKISVLRQINPNLEIAVDGGVNGKNVATVVRAGADVLNVGSYIQKAHDAKEAYATLKQAVEKAVS